MDVPQDESILEEQIAYYRARAPEYDEFFKREGRYDKGAEHTARWESEVASVRRAFQALPLHGDVLELACGTGVWTAELARHDVRVTAIDSSPEALSINGRRVDSSAVTYLEQDIFEWQPTRLYDAVVFTFWLSHIPPERFDEFWDKVGRALAPGGRVFFLDNRWYPEYRWPHGADHGDASESDDPWVVARALNDGRRFNIVKVFYKASELRQRLIGLGWDGHIEETREFFIWGELKRTRAAG